MSSNIEPTSIGLTEKLEEKKLSLDAGMLGKFFGSSRNAPTNIAGLIAVLLVLTCVAAWTWPAENIATSEVWNTFLPVITLILGFLFGKKAA